MHRQLSPPGRPSLSFITNHSYLNQMKHRIIASIIIAAASFLFIAGSAAAAPTSTIVQNLFITQQASTGNPCLSIGTNGFVSTSTCGSGGGSATSTGFPLTIGSDTISGSTSTVSLINNFDGILYIPSPYSSSTYGDFGTYVTNWYNAQVANGLTAVEVMIPPSGIPSSNWTQPVIASSTNTTLLIHCSADAPMFWTGANTSTIINEGETKVGGWNSGYDGCHIDGGVQVSSNTFMYQGGSNGAFGATVSDSFITNFNQGIVAGSNSPMPVVRYTTFASVTQPIDFDFSVTTNSGENEVFDHVIFGDCESGLTTSPTEIYLKNAAGVSFVSTSFDQCHLYNDGGSYGTSLLGGWFENGTNPNRISSEPYIVNATSTTNSLNIFGTSFWNDETSATSTPTSFIQNNGLLNVWGGSTGKSGSSVANFVTSGPGGQTNIYNVLNNGATSIGTITTGIFSGSGSMGIGVSTPMTALDVKGNITLDGNAPQSLIFNNGVYNNSIPDYPSTIAATQAFNSSSTNLLKFYVSNGVTTGTLSTRQILDMTLLGDGNVGIGTAAPSTTLDVNGDITDRNLLLSPFLGTNGTGKIIAVATSTLEGYTDTFGYAKGSATSSLALWNASGTLIAYPSWVCGSGYVYAINTDGTINCSLITAPSEFAPTSVTSTWVISSNGNNWVASAPTGLTSYNGSTSSTINYAIIGSGNVTSTVATSGGNTTTTISLTGVIPIANGGTGATTTSYIQDWHDGFNLSVGNTGPYINQVKLNGPYYIPTAVQANQIQFALTTIDTSTDKYDFGLYSLPSVTSTVATLVFDSGAITASTSTINASSSQGAVIIPAGMYLTGFTGNSTTARFGTGYSQFVLWAAAFGSSSTAGALPATTTVPSQNSVSAVATMPGFGIHM